MSRTLPLLRPSETLTGLYDRMASSWQTGVQKLGFPAAYEDLFRKVSPRDARQVLDLGTGTGAFAAAFLAATRTRPDRLALLDTSRAMLDEAARQLAWQTGALARIHDGVGTNVIPGCSQDLILAAHVFEHLDDPLDALRWTHSSLRPGGQVVFAISRPHWCTALIRWRWGHAAWAPPVVQSMLEKAGFTDIRHIPFPSGPPARTSAGYVARRAG